MRVSVIIPTFGRPAYLEEALNSVANQTHPAHEVIVVDDGSPRPADLTGVLGLNVTLIRHVRNQGVGAARNTGLAHATGEYVLFLDDDDLLTPIRLEQAALGIGDAPMHAMAVEELSVEGLRSKPGRRNLRFEGDLRNVFPYGTSLGDHPRTGQVVHRRDTVLQFDPTLRRCEDSDWWIRMGESAIVVWSDEVGLLVRVHEGIRHDKSHEAIFEARRILATRHGSHSSPAQRAMLYRLVSTAAARADRPTQAAFWSLKYLFTSPSLRRAAFTAKLIVGLVADKAARVLRSAVARGKTAPRDP